MALYKFIIIIIIVSSSSKLKLVNWLTSYARRENTRSVSDADEDGNSSEEERQEQYGCNDDARRLGTANAGLLGWCAAMRRRQRIDVALIRRCSIERTRNSAIIFRTQLYPKRRKMVNFRTAMRATHGGWFPASEITCIVSAGALNSTRCPLGVVHGKRCWSHQQS